jgi:uncharacterized protein (DUF433 family)
MAGAPAMLLSAEQVIHLAGITKPRLRYWEDTEALVAEHAGPGGRAPYYTFRDAVAIRVLALLRQRGVQLAELRRAGKWLAERWATPWSSLGFFVDGRQVYFRDPDTDEIAAIHPRGQHAMKKVVRLEALAHSMRSKVERLGHRRRKQVGKVETKRGVMHGKSVIAGTRVPTAAIWSFHSAGYTPEQVRAEYPHLELADIRAAIDREKKARRAA